MDKPYFVLVETNKLDGYSTLMEAIKSAMRGAVASGGDKHYTILEVHDEMVVNGAVYTEQ